MLTQYLSIPILLIAAIMQSTLMPEFQILSGRADLIFTITLAWTLLAGGEQGILWALVGGICQDLVTGMPLGLSALALVVVMFAVGRILRPLDRANWIVPLGVAAIGTGTYHLLLIVLYALFGRPTPLMYSLINVTLPTAGLNVVLMLPVFRLMGALYTASTPRRVTL